MDSMLSSPPFPFKFPIVPPPPPGRSVLQLLPLFLLPQPGTIRDRSSSSICCLSAALLQLDPARSFHTDGSSALLSRLLLFHLHPLLVCLLAGDGDVVLFGEGGSGRV